VGAEEDAEISHLEQRGDPASDRPSANEMEPVSQVGSSENWMANAAAVLLVGGAAHSPLSARPFEATLRIRRWQ